MLRYRHKAIGGGVLVAVVKVMGDLEYQDVIPTGCNGLGASHSFRMEPLLLFASYSSIHDLESHFL